MATRKGMGLFQQSVLANYLSANDEAETEWMEYFNKQKAKADELKAQIDQTDKQINVMVYELYGLGEEEIGIVEGGL